MTFANSGQKAITFILEPWAEIYPLEPQAKLTVCFNSPIPPVSPHTVEVEYGADYITVYAWEGCTSKLFQDGEELRVAEVSDIPEPRVPPGIEILKNIGFLSSDRNFAW